MTGIKKALARQWPLCFILPGLVGFILFYIWPFFYAMRYAFVDKPIGGIFVGLQNFISLLQNSTYLLGLKNTVIFILIIVPLNLIIPLLIALALRSLKNRNVLTLLFLAPLVIPSGSMVFFWKSFFAEYGYLNSLLAQLGVERIKWLSTGVVRYVMIFIFLWKHIGYNVILFSSGLSNIPREYYEAAAVDGAGAWRTFRCITVRELLPTFIVTTLMSIIYSFRIFKEIHLITGSYPHESIYMLQHFMNNMFSSLNYQKLITATCYLVLILSAVISGLFKMERRVSE